MIHTGNSQKLFEEFKKSMMSKFEMTDLGLPHYFLGMEVVRDSRGIFSCQEKYSTDLLKKFKMSRCKPVKTPMSTNEKLVLDVPYE